MNRRRRPTRRKRSRWFRPGIIYGFKVHRPRGWRTPWGYIGKTRQRLGARVAQHLTGPDAQPWADLVDPCSGTVAHVLYRGERVSAIGLAWREWWYIRTRRPIYNVTWNLANPRHVPKWRAVKQRQKRDARRSTPAGGHWGLPVRQLAGVVLLLASVAGVLLLASLATMA